MNLILRRCLSSLASGRAKHDQPVIENYLSESTFRAKADDVPFQFKTSLKNQPKSLICIDENTASLMANAVSQNISTGSLSGVPIIEMGAGLGILSKELLKQGADNLRLYEPHPQMNEVLHQLTSSNKVGKLQVFLHDLHNLTKIFPHNLEASLQEEDCNTDIMDEIMVGVEKKDPAELACVVVGAGPKQNFTKLILHMTATNKGFPQYGQTEYFLAVHPHNYVRMTARPADGYFKYRSHSVAFQIFYDIKLLEKLDRKSFLPWEKPFENSSRKKRTNNFEMMKYDEDHLYFIHMKPRKVVHELSCYEKRQLIYFLKFHLKKRSEKVMTLMQKWVPDCKDRLNYLGIRDDTIIGTFTPNQLYALFKNFISWPEFPNCSFDTSMEWSFLRSNETNLEKIEL